MAPDGELHELSKIIGRLEEGLHFLARQVQINQETMVDEHRKVHEIVDALSASVRTLTSVVNEMKPLTDDYRERRAEARGAARLLNAVYALGGGIVAMMGNELVRLFFGRRL